MDGRIKTTLLLSALTVLILLIGRMIGGHGGMLTPLSIEWTSRRATMPNDGYKRIPL